VGVALAFYLSGSLGWDGGRAALLMLPCRPGEGGRAPVPPGLLRAVGEDAAVSVRALPTVGPCLGSLPLAWGQCQALCRKCRGETLEKIKRPGGGSVRIGGSAGLWSPLLARGWGAGRSFLLSLGRQSQNNRGVVNS